MTSEVQYVEVPESSVRPGVVRAAEALVRFLAMDLGLPMPRVRWLAPGNRQDTRLAFALGRTTVMKPRPIYGLYRGTEPDTVFLEVSAPSSVVAHEVRHYWQSRQPGFAQRSREDLEQDANAYARDAVDRWRKQRSR
jgi:hypothetical protein